MRYLSLILAVFMASCASRSAVFSSSSGNVTLSYIPRDKNGRPAYRISAEDGSELGRFRSIIDSETVKNVPGLPVDQEVIQSPSGRTALIYENMSDASPDYQHILIRLHPDSRSYQAFKIDLGTRHSSQEDIYGHWPSVVRVSDSVVELEWSSGPKNETVEIAQLLADSESISEQDAP